MKLGIDCRELTRGNISALGLIVLQLLKHSGKNEFVLFSDVPVEERYVPTGCRNIYWGKPNRGGVDVVFYHRWLESAASHEELDAFYEVDHYALFKIKNVPQITTIHDTYVLEGFEKYPFYFKPMYRAFIKRTIKNSELVTVVSDFTKKRVEYFFGPHDNIKTVKIGVELSETSYDIAPIIRAPFFLSLGRLSTWKGTLRLAEFFCNHYSNRGIKLVFAGRCDPREEHIKKKLLFYCDMCENIVWLDYVTNSEREWLIRNCKAMLYPSLYDGFGLPPLEAAARGVQCIANDTPVLREVTENLGCFVDYYGEDGDIVTKLDEVLDGNPLLEENLFKLKAKVETEYNWDVASDNLYRAIRDVVRR